jgi:hypothetical protein
VRKPEMEKEIVSQAVRKFFSKSNSIDEKVHSGCAHSRSVRRWNVASTQNSFCAASESSALRQQIKRANKEKTTTADNEISELNQANEAKARESRPRDMRWTRRKVENSRHVGRLGWLL